MDSNIYDDYEYELLVNDILHHKEFEKTKNIAHHGTTRYDHSVRVSYRSYKIAKCLGLDYVAVARAGLLHDFFLVDNKTISFKEEIGTLWNHPVYAEKYASKFFKLSLKEKDIISTHMFPIGVTRVPKYLESWVVSTIDKSVALEEKSYSMKIAASRIINFLILIFISSLGK